MRTVIVGSGIAGAAAGYELARNGVDVTLVDSRIEGRATSAGAGIICPWSSRVDDPDWYRFAVAGAEYYEELRAGLAADGETDLGYRKVGSLRLTTEGEAEDVLRRVSERAATSPLAGDVELVDARRARELFPPLGHEGPALHIPGAARLDGRLVRDAMCRAAARHGARIVEGTAALVADGADGAVRGVRVDGETIGADSVIVAAGAWAPELLEPLGVHVRVEPQRGQIMHLRLPGADTMNWPVVLPMSRHYLLAFDDSRVVVGATREDGAGFDHRVTAAGMKEVLDEALGVAPASRTPRTWRPASGSARWDPTSARCSARSRRSPAWSWSTASARPASPWARTRARSRPVWRAGRSRGRTSRRSTRCAEHPNGHAGLGSCPAAPQSPDSPSPVASTVVRNDATTGRRSIRCHVAHSRTDLWNQGSSRTVIPAVRPVSMLRWTNAMPSPDATSPTAVSGSGASKRMSGVNPAAAQAATKSSRQTWS